MQKRFVRIIAVVAPQESMRFVTPVREIFRCGLWIDQRVFLPKIIKERCQRSSQLPFWNRDLVLALESLMKKTQQHRRVLRPQQLKRRQFQQQVDVVVFHACEGDVIKPARTKAVQPSKSRLGPLVFI